MFGNFVLDLIFSSNKQRNLSSTHWQRLFQPWDQKSCPTWLRSRSRGKPILTYQTVCLLIFTRDKSARVKTATFAPLIEASLGCSNLTGKMFGLQDVFAANTVSQLARDLGISKLIEK